MRTNSGCFEKPQKKTRLAKKKRRLQAELSVEAAIVLSEPDVVLAIVLSELDTGKWH